MDEGCLNSRNSLLIQLQHFFGSCFFTHNVFLILVIMICLECGGMVRKVDLTSCGARQQRGYLDSVLAM